MKITNNFNNSDAGMIIITYLVKTFPPPQGMYLNLYRDVTCRQVITYGQLSESISKLNLQRGQTLYFKAEINPIF